jgi:hypothetical protein
LLERCGPVGHVVGLRICMHSNEFAVSEASVETLGESFQNCDGGCRDRVRHLYRLPDNHHCCCKGDIRCIAKIIRRIVAEKAEGDSASQAS